MIYIQLSYMYRFVPCNICICNCIKAKHKCYMHNTQIISPATCKAQTLNCIGGKALSGEKGFRNCKFDRTHHGRGPGAVATHDFAKRTATHMFQGLYIRYVHVHLYNLEPSRALKCDRDEQTRWIGQIAVGFSGFLTFHIDLNFYSLVKFEMEMPFEYNHQR